MARYEVMSLMTHQKHVDKKLKHAQENGWEICGDILIKNESGCCNDTYLHIPMKRIIKENEDV